MDALLLISASLLEAVEDVVLICRDDEFRYRETFASQRIRPEYPQSFHRERQNGYDQLMD